MSDMYEVAGVQITPAGGGYYDLSHFSLAEPERVRGKENADARAVELSAANPLVNADVTIPKQGDLGNAPPAGDAPTSNGGATPPADITSTASLSGNTAPPPAPAPKPSPEAQQAASQAANPNTDPEPEEGEDPRDAKIRALQAQMSDMLTALQHVTTVQSTAAPIVDAVPLDIGREFAGQMSKAQKAAFKKAGFEVVTIVLEENDSIPPTGLFVGHNGRGYMIKPGENVDVPDFLLGVLDDAVMSAPITDPSTQKVLGYRNRSKYPYRRV
jgi:hypothetical protein